MRRRPGPTGRRARLACFICLRTAQPALLLGLTPFVGRWLAAPVPLLGLGSLRSI
jgi:hypothetical protein